MGQPPFEAARGRKPKLPSNICLGTSESASAYKSLDDTAAEAVEYLNLANKLVKEALEKSRTLGQEALNQKQVRVDFEVGELVRFWNRVPARKKEGPSKLKLRNAVYKVLGHKGQVVIPRMPAKDPPCTPDPPPR